MAKARDAYEERVALRRIDGGLRLEDAEAEAFTDTVMAFDLNPGALSRALTLQETTQ